MCCRRHDTRHRGRKRSEWSRMQKVLIYVVRVNDNQQTYDEQKSVCVCIVVPPALLGIVGWLSRTLQRWCLPDSSPQAAIVRLIKVKRISIAVSLSLPLSLLQLIFLLFLVFVPFLLFLSPLLFCLVYFSIFPFLLVDCSLSRRVLKKKNSAAP